MKLKVLVGAASAACLMLVPATADAYNLNNSYQVKRFQKARGLQVDGVIGVQTHTCFMQKKCKGVAPGPLRKKIRRNNRNHPGAWASSGSTSYEVPPASVAQCESGGDPTTDTGNGFFGKWQFTQATWEAMGGSGNPAHASEQEQDYRAAKLWNGGAGRGNWPVCGYR